MSEWIETDRSFVNSVLPPPPRYPQAGQYIGVGGPGAIPTIETNNTLTTREGPEYQFLVGEGESILRSSPTATRGKLIMLCDTLR